VTERIRAAVERGSVDWNGERLSITISGGVASFPEGGMNSTALIGAADAALYAAKRAGRNRMLAAASTAAPADRQAGSGPGSPDRVAPKDTHARPPVSIRSSQ
jgi:predicted signal transduction protein with EAL and GGDEF domain